MKSNDELYIFQYAKEVASVPVFIGFHDFQTATQPTEDHDFLDMGRSLGVASTPFPYVILNVRDYNKDNCM